jgi:hypothetical protein
MFKPDLYKFIESKIGLAVSDDTIFFDNVGIDGLDALTFMDEFAKNFNVDMSNFDHSAFIVDDSSLLKRIFTSSSTHKRFTALHLFNVLQKGYWFDPPLV